MMSSCDFKKLSLLALGLGLAVLGATSDAKVLLLGIALLAKLAIALGILAMSEGGTPVPVRPDRLYIPGDEDDEEEEGECLPSRLCFAPY